MALIKRHWLAFSLHTLLIVIGAGWLTWSLLESDSAVGQTPDPVYEVLDPQDYTQINRLRQKLSLSNQDLAAMGCTQQQAVSILASLRQWYELRSSALAQTESLERQRVDALRRLQRQIHAGPRNESSYTQLSPAESDMALAKAARNQIESEHLSVIDQFLSGTQQSLWQSFRLNVQLGVPARYRYVSSVSETQAQQLRQMLKRIHRDSSLNDSAILTGAQRIANQERALQIESRLEQMMAAEADVLPLPESYLAAVHPPNPVE